MSKANKKREKLAQMADRSREEYEMKRRELEEEMHKGRANISKIQKGLKNNEIVEDPHFLEMEGTSPTKKTVKSSATKKSPPKALVSMDSSLSYDAQSFMPTGLRVSDWCFNGPLDSSPPVVKTNSVYESIRPLGRGAFGDVYLVKNIDDNKLFANKTMLCEREADMKEMMREVKFLRMNRHPCIIDIHDGYITSQPRILNIVTSYCEAGDLAKVIIAARKTRTNIPESQIIKWSLQIALALHFIHENGLIHRDLKPNNVMLAEGGEIVKVADFGLALDTSDETMYHSGEAGTPVYTAPEMILGEKYSYPADCFSFGVMLHEFLRLDLPFHGNTTTDLVRSILQEEPPPLPGHYSEDLKAISMCLLEKDPNRRLGFAGLLMEPLFQSKVASFPASYRPKALEERIRRAQTRQLQSQIDALLSSRNSSTTPAVMLLAESARIKAEAQAALDAAAAAAAEEAQQAITESNKTSPSFRGIKTSPGNPKPLVATNSELEVHSEAGDRIDDDSEDVTLLPIIPAAPSSRPTSSASSSSPGVPQLPSIRQSKSNASINSLASSALTSVMSEPDTPTAELGKEAPAADNKLPML